MAVDVAAKPGHSRDRIREVESLDHRLIELFGGQPLLDREDELPQVLIGDRRRLDRADLTVDSQQRRGAGLKVHVRGPLFDREPDQLVEIHG